MTMTPADLRTLTDQKDAYANYLFNLSTVGEHNLDLMADPYSRHDYDAEQELRMDAALRTA